MGSRAMKPMRRITTKLVDAGYAVASVDYRTIGRGGSRSRGVEDVRMALDWWRSEHARFGLDLARVAVVGLSAGATLALLATEDLSEEVVASRISVFGLYDVGELDGLLATAIRGLLLRGGDPRAMSPRWAISSPAPLTLLHGTADQLVPVQQARQLAMLRRAAGLPVELHVLEGAPHGFFNAPGQFAEQGLQQLLVALSDHLGH
jgi:acetyl esterase/lipase